MSKRITKNPRNLIITMKENRRRVTGKENR
jgi:hypothetical protein